MEIDYQEEDEISEKAIRVMAIATGGSNEATRLHEWQCSLYLFKLSEFFHFLLLSLLCFGLAREALTTTLVYKLGKERG